VAIEQDVIQAARDRGTRLVVGTPLQWLITRGHLEPIVQREAPDDVLAPTFTGYQLLRVPVSTPNPRRVALTIAAG